MQEFIQLLKNQQIQFSRVSEHHQNAIADKQFKWWHQMHKQWCSTQCFTGQNKQTSVSGQLWCMPCIYGTLHLVPKWDWHCSKYLHKANTGSLMPGTLVFQCDMLLPIQLYHNLETIHQCKQQMIDTNNHHQNLCCVDHETDVGMSNTRLFHPITCPSKCLTKRYFMSNFVHLSCKLQDFIAECRS